MNLYQRLVACNLLRPLDRALAETLQRLAPDTPDSVLAAAALASCALHDGHSAIDTRLLPALPDRALAAALHEAWLRDVPGSRWIAFADDAAQPAAPTCPLVLERGLLYLRRYREYERELATALRQLSQHPQDTPEPDTLTPLFARLFPAGGEDPQAQAALGALQHRLLLLTGGPGTGKTTTVARILLLLIARAQAAGQPAPRITLTAPTGQAAARMAASVRSAAQRWQQDGIDPALCAALPSAGQTIHRLLGTQPGSARLRHHAGHPIESEIVVVDEVSMMDLPLMAKLAAALPAQVRLILLGDPDQLPSVEVGDVLGALAAQDTCIHRVHLHRSYRQHDTLQLAPLAEAVRSGDATRTLDVLRGGGLSNVHFHEHLRDPLAVHQTTWRAQWRILAEAATPAQALAHVNDLRILTAVRDGAQGARTLNARIAHLLAAPGARGQHHFHGQPIVILENSYRQHLFNGDIGICHRDGNGVLMAWFAGEDATTPRAFPLPALPTHEPAFATTVHKAQGAEFASVWLLLPERDSQILTRELLYTALTRARQHLHLFASAQTITAALSRHTRRCTGLGWRLWLP